MNTRHFLSAILLLGASSPASSTDYFLEYDGVSAPAPLQGLLSQGPIGADPMFEPPLIANDGTCLPGEGIDTYRYDTITIANTAGVPVDLGVEVNTADCTDSGDNPRIFAYSGSFNPAIPVTNCRIANDNYRAFCSRVIAPIAAGQSAVFVITSYRQTEHWPWTARFDDTISYGAFENYLVPLD